MAFILLVLQASSLILRVTQEYLVKGRNISGCSQAFNASFVDTFLTSPQRICLSKFSIFSKRWWVKISTKENELYTGQDYFIRYFYAKCGSTQIKDNDIKIFYLPFLFLIHQLSQIYLCMNWMIGSLGISRMMVNLSKISLNKDLRVDTQDWSSFLRLNMIITSLIYL